MLRTDVVALGCTALSIRLVQSNGESRWGRKGEGDDRGLHEPQDPSFFPIVDFFSMQLAGAECTTNSFGVPHTLYHSSKE